MVTQGLSKGIKEAVAGVSDWTLMSGLSVEDQVATLDAKPYWTTMIRSRQNIFEARVANEQGEYESLATPAGYAIQDVRP